jgi:hypothetical protein
MKGLPPTISFNVTETKIQYQKTQHIYLDEVDKTTDIRNVPPYLSHQHLQTVVQYEPQNSAPKTTNQTSHIPNVYDPRLPSLNQLSLPKTKRIMLCNNR